MSQRTLWIPPVGGYVSVPSPTPGTLERSVMGVTKRVKKDGKRFIQCGEYLFPLEVCSSPRWIPKQGERIRAKTCLYEGRVNGLFIHEQGYVMADCRMYHKPNGKPVEPCFRVWTSPVNLLEPMGGKQHD